MPFQSARRHEIWSVDIRYIDHHLPESELPEGGGKVYAISILENHFESHTGERHHHQPGPHRLPRLSCTPPSRDTAPRKFWSATGRGLQSQPGEGGLPLAGHNQRGDRAPEAVAKFHRDDVQHSAPNGRLLLRQGRKLGRDSSPPTTGGCENYNTQKPLGAPGQEGRPP